MIGTVELFPIQLLIIVLLTNRYVFGPLLMRLGRGDADRTDDAYRPKVAVVIPLFNEGEGVYFTIQSLLGQDYPSDELEIIVIDDCSNDDSLVWATRAAQGHPNVRVLRNPVNMGKRMGMIRAVRNTNAEIIVSVDSDVVVDRRAICELVRRFTSPRIAAVGGRTYVANRDDSWLTQMTEVKFYFAQMWLKCLERAFRSVLCLSGCLTAYRRQILLELESILENRNVVGVPILYGEDRFLTRQILKAGYQTVYAEDAWCFTAAPADLSSYFSQQLRWRRSNLIDVFCGLGHVCRLHPVIVAHSLSLFALLLVYPVIVVHNVVNGELFEMIGQHLGFVAVLALIYRVANRHLPPERRVPAFAFLPIAVVMPVSYLLFTPLALFSLDSGSWETRGHAAEPAPQELEAAIVAGGWRCAKKPFSVSMRSR